MKQKLLKKMGLIILVVSLFTSFAVMITNMLLDTCSIKYVTYGGNMFIEEVVRGTKITLDNNISRDGYDFVGWTMGEDNNIVSEIVVKNDTILVANWKVVEHSISYNGTSYVVYNNAVITYRDNTVSFTTVDGNMVTLCGAKDYDWKLSEGSVTTPITNSFSLNYSKSSEVELSQEYRGETFSISIMENEGYIVNAGAIDVNSGENVIFEVVLQDGYTNSNIYIEGIEYSAINIRPGVYVVTLYGVTKDMHIDILGVKKNTYKVLLDYDGGEYIKGLGEYELQHGDKLYLPIPKKAGYNFLYWIDTRTNLVIDKEDVLVTDNMTLKAIYRLAIYTVKLPTSTSGSYVTTYLNSVITDTNNVYEATKEDTITFTVSVSEMYDSASVQLYYMLDTVRVDIPVVANGLNVSATVTNVNADIIILVEPLSVRKYTVNINYNGGVDDAMQKGSSYTLYYGSFVMLEKNVLTFVDYISGESISVGNITKLGSTLSNYMCGSLILTNTSIQSLGNGNIDISVQWNRVEGVITLNGNGGVFEGGATVVEMLAKDYTLDIVPTKLGYTFVGWYTKLIEVNGQIDHSLSVKLDSIDIATDTVVYAGWVQNR